jgi:hypothetical protein
LEFAALLRMHGFAARRGQQFAGGTSSPDVVCQELAGFHLEVKREQRLRLAQAVAQTKRDSERGAPVGGRKPWLLAHRVNHGEWFITMDGRDLSRLLQRVAPFADLEPFVAPWLTLEAEVVLQLLRAALREPFEARIDLTADGHR